MHPIDPEVLMLAKSRRGLYLPALSAPRSAVPGLLALLALDAELASIPAKVSEPMLGRIRLQWWRDVLPGIVSGRAPSHPVAQAMSPLGLALDDVRAFVDAHGFVHDTDTADMAEIEAYAKGRGGALARMMAGVLKLRDPLARDSAEKAGEAFILAELLAYKTRLGEGDLHSVRALAMDRITQSRGAKLGGAVRRQALPCLLQARVARRILLRPDAPLGAGVVLSLWWASVMGRA